MPPVPQVAAATAAILALVVGLAALDEVGDEAARNLSSGDKNPTVTQQRVPKTKPRGPEPQARRAAILVHLPEAAKPVVNPEKIQEIFRTGLVGKLNTGLRVKALDESSDLLAGDLPDGYKRLSASDSCAIYFVTYKLEDGVFTDYEVTNRITNGCSGNDRIAREFNYVMTKGSRVYQNGSSVYIARDNGVAIGFHEQK